ncbi:hypothetical protein FB451DRAFT_1562981 [Mycena latifolia]|nr:hypothetical protein FB451DRAFT_1562981 [Mycena latifolia]
MLVAWRVKEWSTRCSFAPSQYPMAGARPHPGAMNEYASFTSKRLLAAIQTKPAAFFRDSVLNLYLHHALPDALPAILVCAGVENLWIAGMPGNLVSSFPSMPLKHLHTTLGPFLRTFPPDHSLFAHITHLELFDYADDTTVWSGLSLIPRLIHLALNAHALITISLYVPIFWKHAHFSPCLSVWKHGTRSRMKLIKQLW